MIQIHEPRWTHAAVYVFPAVLAAIFAFLYVGMQIHGLYGGDAGDLTTNAYIFGIPHAPGYPLYTFLAGIMAHVLPWNTVEWRVCFLSSLPVALSLFFLWRVCFRLTKSFISSTVAVILYGLFSPVWLSAITQEVFGLLSLFTAVWMERYLAWQEEKRPKQLLFLAFWTGLALTHHQLIVLCIVPALFLIFFRLRDLRTQMVDKWWKLLLLGGLGLVPYIYLPIASYLGTPFDQEHASTVTGFIRLVTRASYGSFRATANLTPTLIDRFLNVFTFFQFSLTDVGIIGCILILIGVVVLRKTHRDMYDYLIGCLFLWIFYFFYAGFPLLLNYQIGTLERFFIVPYQFLMIFLSVGVVYVLHRLTARYPKKSAILPLISGLFCLIIFAASGQHIRENFRAFSFLRHDTSMEGLAGNLLLSAPKDSILFLVEDTTTYAIYDALYVHGQRPDIHFVRLQLLGLPYYRAYLRKTYPDLYVPAETTGTSMVGLVTDFLTKNVQRFPIMSDQVQSEIDGLWLPYGLLYSYFPDKTGTLDYTPLFDVNQNLWKQFFLPESLFTYQKELPMLSDVLRVYSQHRVNVANVAVLAHMPIEKIVPEVKESLRLGINVVPEYYIPPVVLLLGDKRCADAKTVLSILSESWGDDKTLLRLYVSWQNTCGSDADVDAKVASFRKQFPGETDSLPK